MKKHLIAVLIAVVMCLAVLSGCSMMKSLEKDVSVVAKDGTNVLKTGVVNTFNSMIMPAYKADGQSFEDSAEQGYYFAGWSTVENWKEGEEGCDESKFFGKEYITYADVKEFATDGAVVLYPAYKIKINYFFVFGYYAWTSTSGLDEATMKPVAEALEGYLNENYSSEITTFLATDPDHNKVFDMRGYNPGGNSIGGAGDMVNKDGDVGVFFGGGNNMDSTGKMYCYAKTNNDGSCIHIGGKTGRVAGLLKDDAVSLAVFNWFQNYVKDNIDSAYTVQEMTYDMLQQPVVEEPVEPPVEQPETPAVAAKRDIYLSDTVLNVSVWSNNESWVTNAQVEQLKVDFQEYIALRVVNSNAVTINWTIETVTGVANLGSSVLTAGNIDFVLGCGNNVDSTAGLSNLKKLKIDASDYMAKERFIAVLNADSPNQLAVLLYVFMSGVDYPSAV